MEQIYLAGIRKVIKQGGSLIITLPKGFIEKHDIRRGDKIAYSASGEVLQVKLVKAPAVIQPAMSNVIEQPVK